MNDFQRFGTQMISCLLEQRCQWLSSVRRAIKELRFAVGGECSRLEAALPIYPKKTPIIDTVNENQVSVAFGEIGLGKSTQMTQYFYEAGFAKNGLIVCTQPKKRCCH